MYYIKFSLLNKWVYNILKVIDIKKIRQTTQEGVYWIY